MPKVSVIVPVYNVENYLKECLDSIVNQTLKDIEIILINDASTDSSLSICQEYSNNDDRVLIINNEKNLNAGVSRNNGLSIAQGEYIYFMDSDDFLELNALEKVINIMEKTIDIDFCMFKQISIDEANKQKIFDNTFTYKNLNIDEYLNKPIKHIQFPNNFNFYKKYYWYDFYCEMTNRHRLKKRLQKIFSVTNSKNKTHKIITISGIKIKLKRRGNR